MKLKLPNVLVLLLCCQFAFAFNGKDVMLANDTLDHTANGNEIILEVFLVSSYTSGLHIADEPSKVSGTSGLIDFPMHVDIRFTMQSDIFLEHQIGFYAETTAFATDNDRSVNKIIICK